ncbi:MAG: tetratricopeptide repeat protein, partial [Anaerolineae bacterium]|nr:tetratricopeptide repeat protein [Anaerolineae bacterium]
MTRMGFYRIIAAVLGGLLLTGCGLVDVRVAPIPTPTLAATDAPPLEVLPSAGLVAYSAPDDESMIVRTVAYPHLVYAPDGMAIEMMEQWPAEQEYLLYDNGVGLRLRADWRALWLTDAYGSGHVVMDVALQSPGMEDFEYAQYAATQPFEAWGSDFRNELLDATLYFSAPGVYRVRAVVTAKALDDGGNEVVRDMTYEVSVLALSSPLEEPTGDPADFAPRFGEVESWGFLLDWRGWDEGPCYIQTDDNAEATRRLDEACVAVENGDAAGAEAALTAALDTVSDNPYLLGLLRGQLGLLASAQGQWNVAARHFQESLERWRAEDRSQEVVIALHNLGIALLAVERWDEGNYHLSQSAQLAEQMQDWGGAMLSWAQLSRYWDSQESLDYMAGEMTNNGWAQAWVLQSWADELRARTA